MSRSKRRSRIRAESQPSPGNAVNSQPTLLFLKDSEFCAKISAGYTPLSQVPEIKAGVDLIANLISSMTVYLISNTKGGDTRILNQLSRFLDIEPHPYLTRQKLINWLVRTLLLEGDGNCVMIPRTRDGSLYSLDPVSPARVSKLSAPDGGYRILIDGIARDPSELLDFTVNQDPQQYWLGRGYRVPLKLIADNLLQAESTQNAFMSSKYMPPLIVKVDANSDTMATEKGRAEIASKYLETSGQGLPWIIPTELMDVQQVKPLNLNDLAIADTVKLNKKTAATILGIPAFVYGEGAFSAAEWNGLFIKSRLMPMVQGIEQEMTRKLIRSPDWYVRFNPRSLYAYDLKDLATIAKDLRAQGIMSGNEVRDWIGLDPKEGLDELVMLENYIPADKLGDQQKLQGGS